MGGRRLGLLYDAPIHLRLGDALSEIPSAVVEGVTSGVYGTVAVDSFEGRAKLLMVGDVPVCVDAVAARLYVSTRQGLADIRSCS